MAVQLDLFNKSPLSSEEFDYGKGDIKEPAQDTQSFTSTPLCDKIESVLDELVKDSERMNHTIQSLIDELQADWTEDEKLQVNDPKEWQRRQKEKEPKEQPIMKLSSDVIESLKRCKIEGNTLFLPPISEGPLENYQQVRQALMNAGATYKKNTFIFKSDAQPFIDRLTSGESANIKKEFQFFPTPDDIADHLVSLAGLQESDRILEPSAGQGAIVNAILRQNEHAIIECCELMPENADILLKAGYKVIRNDFMQITDRKSAYDKIIANPPFNKNQDIDHIFKMWECLKPGGRIVTIASKHWQHSNNKKEKQFREWLYMVGAEIISIDGGQFKESGTMVATCIVVINKLA